MLDVHWVAPKISYFFDDLPGRKQRFLEENQREQIEITEKFIKKINESKGFDPSNQFKIELDFNKKLFDKALKAEKEWKEFIFRWTIDWCNWLQKGNATYVLFDPWPFKKDGLMVWSDKYDLSDPRVLDQLDDFTALKTNFDNLLPKTLSGILEGLRQGFFILVANQHEGSLDKCLFAFHFANRLYALNPEKVFEELYTAFWAQIGGTISPDTYRQIIKKLEIELAVSEKTAFLGKNMRSTDEEIEEVPSAKMKSQLPRSKIIVSRPPRGGSDIGLKNFLTLLQRLKEMKAIDESIDVVEALCDHFVNYKGEEFNRGSSDGTLGKIDDLSELYQRSPSKPITDKNKSIELMVSFVDGQLFKDFTEAVTRKTTGKPLINLREALETSLNLYLGNINKSGR